MPQIGLPTKFIHAVRFTASSEVLGWSLSLMAANSRPNRSGAHHYPDVVLLVLHMMAVSQPHRYWIPGMPREQSLRDWDSGASLGYLDKAARLGSGNPWNPGGAAFIRGGGAPLGAQAAGG